MRSGKQDRFTMLKLSYIVSQLRQLSVWEMLATNHIENINYMNIVNLIT